MSRSPSEPPQPSVVEAYVREHAGRFTDDAIYATLVGAGHPPDEVRAALAAVQQPAPTAPRAIRAILGAYFVVFLLLSIGMLLNSRPAGYLMPAGAGGIAILGIGLAAAFGLSLIWIASRRAFIVLAAVVVGLGFLSSFSGSVSNLQLVLVAAVIGVVLFAASRGAAAGSRGQTSMAVLLVVPILLLLGVAGLCVASGLPIPGAA